MTQKKTFADFSKTYDSIDVEKHLYEQWEQSGCFKASEDTSKPVYTIVIPPPNVTGMLTMGHVLNNTLQDILIRYHRMLGKETLWLPGTDHAGIATQNVVEKTLAKQKISRHDLGREQFLQKVWEWKDKYGSIILDQLKRLGCSCDWDRERFTMDEGLSEAVKKCFVELYKNGLVYKGKYIINWCPRCQTALSDEEKIPQDTNGKLWHMKYPLKDGKGYVVVATTRPETMLGDTAVAVNPKDERYLDFIGKKLVLPFLNREIPIIADDYVDMSFGSGAVKVTPAHDPNDFDMGNRHNLQRIIVMNEDGVMNENAGKFNGLDRFAARDAVVEGLEELGLLEKIDEHQLAVGHCERCKTVIEPYLSDQWFVKMKPLAEKAMELVQTGELRFTPERWVGVYLHWLKNIRDWCISRQLWWGHRIPAYNCSECGHLMVEENAPESCSKCSAVNSMKQEEDVLDTWFSSWLWPFSTMGWPEETQTLEKFYPTDTLVTGPDIIFFWVARMVMAGHYFRKQCPFKNVYFTSIVRDMKGRKMSKSLGNSPDPLEIINQYGADALRYTIIALAPVGQDVKFSEKQVELGRNFANKLWNAARFVMMNLESSQASVNKPFPVFDELSEADRWIISRLNSAVKSFKHYLSESQFKFNDALKSIYEFIWNEYCDWYIEMSKPDLNCEEQQTRENVRQVLLLCLANALKILHPFMPFITEEIWQKLPGSDGFLMTSSFPEIGQIDEKLESNIDFMIKAVKTVRNLRASANIAPSKKAVVRVVKNDEHASIFEQHANRIKNLVALSGIQYVAERPEGHLVGLFESNEVCLDLAGIIDVQAEIKRITKELEKTEKEMAKISVKLENKNFIERAPAEVIDKIQTGVKDYKVQIEKLNQYYKELERLNK